MTPRTGSTGPKPLRPGLVLPDLPGAVCKGKDPAPWFPRASESPEEGKALCRACPARGKCLDWALDNNERLGTWGATTPAERATILRQLRDGTGREAVA